MQRGVLDVLHPGVDAYGHPAASREGRWLAAVFSGGEGSALGYLHAPALMLDLRRFPLGDPVVRRHAGIGRCPAWSSTGVATSIRGT